jgi:acetamidase/formamidase
MVRPRTVSIAGGCRLADAHLDGFLPRNPDLVRYPGLPGRRHDKLPVNALGRDPRLAARGDVGEGSIGNGVVRESLMKNRTACLLVAALAQIAHAQAPRTHDLPLAPAHVHWGYYDARIPPVLRVVSGDRVRVETMVAGGLQRLRLAGVAEAEIPESLKTVERLVTERGPGAHPMSGPIFVDGAEPGDSLEVRIVAIEFLHPFGVNAFSPGGGTLPDEYPYAQLKMLRWRAGADRVEFAPGIMLPLAPFFGSIGVAPPPLVGRISSRPPGWHGGNLDNKDLVAGSVLYLPVHVPGALLSIGDGHGMQGDGEVTGTALETSLRGTFELQLHKQTRLRWPRAETPTHYIAMGLHEDLDEAARLATREMVDFLVTEKGLTRDAAYMLCSLAVDLRVTQVVDQTKGVHAMLAKSVFNRRPPP